MFNQSYDLPLSADYVKSWGVTEAVREIAQNCLDSESPFEWSIDKQDDETFTLTLSSRFSHLTPANLVLGNSSKSDNDDQIGQFGEGFKLAMLVLTRENHRLKIVNNESVWLPEFSYSKKFGCDILKVKTEKNNNNPTGLHFIVDGLSEDQMQKIYTSNLHMREYDGPIKETSYGNILLEEPGKLFVNGLFVCDTDLSFGYDIKPEYLKLDRDRKNVDSFDLTLTTATMWKLTKEFDFIAEKMEAKCPDFEGMRFNDSALVKDACYKVFKKKNEGKIVVDSRQELDKLAEEGIVNTVYIGSSYSSFHHSVTTSTGYREQPSVIHRSQPPQVLLKAFFKDHRGNMRTKAIVAFKALINKSESWRLK